MFALLRYDIPRTTYDTQQPTNAAHRSTHISGKPSTHPLGKPAENTKNNTDHPDYYINEAHMSEVRRLGHLTRPRIILSVIGILLLIGICAWGVRAYRSGQTTPTRAFSLIYPHEDTLIATVNATGQIQPAQIVKLNFGSTGRVQEILVSVGDVVTKGTVLARLDSRDLQIRLTQAQAGLAQAQANEQKLRAGATPAEIAAAEAQLAQARGQLRQTQGSVTAADIRAATAQLQQAQAQLARLESGPKETDLRTLEAQLQQAQNTLEAQRNQLSAAKTSAQLQIQQSVNSLTQAQARYATAKQNWDHISATGTDPLTPEIPDSSNPGQTKANDLSAAAREQYYSTYIQAEAALHSAEDALQQAQVSYENARQAEITGIRGAEQQVTVAQANLDKLLAGSDHDQIAAARAQVASAQSNLDKLRGEQRSGTLQSAQAGLAQAQANLQRIQANPQESDLTIAQAQIANAQATLELAQLALDEATLTAPFAGTIAEINLKVGETPSPTITPIILADLSSFHVDVAVDEIDVSRLATSQPVTLTLDALPNLTLTGHVESINPLANAQSSVTSYEVRITATSSDERVRSGMSTNADIIVARKEHALLVPRRAVRNDRGRLIVDTATDQTICTLPADQRPSTPELTPRDVQIGLSNEQVIEITTGLDPRTCVYVEGIDARYRFFEANGPPPGAQNRN